MIKFRLGQREFIRYDSVKWENLIDNFDNEKKVTYKVIMVGRYSKQMEKHEPFIRSYIKRLIKDLKKGYVYENPPGHQDDTEYLARLSYESPEGFLVYSKNIAGDDRLCYIIYPPIELEDSYLVYVEVYSCAGHLRFWDYKEYWSPFPEESRKILEEIKQWRIKKGYPPIN